MTKPKAKAKFRVVYLRLFEEDAAEIDRMAAEKGSAFQTELRMCVSEAVRARALGAKRGKESVVR
jgi:hypothetical protein